MVIEVATKIKKEFSWKDIILYVMIGAFIIFLLSFGILSIIQSKKEIKLSDLINKLTMRSSSEQELENRILKYQKKIKIFSTLLDNHKMPLNVFNFLERNTHPKIWFSKLELNLENNNLNLIGQADDFETVSQQISIFNKNQEYVKKVTIIDVSKDIKEKINFNFKIDLNPQILKP